MTISLGAFAGMLTAVLIVSVIIAFWGIWRVDKEKLDFLIGNGTGIAIAVLPNIEEDDILIVGGREVKVLSTSYDGTTLTVTTGDVDE